MTRAELAAFLSAIGIYYAAAYLTAYVCGRLVERYGVKVNYTRKINHLVTIGAPWLLQQAFRLEANLTAVVLAAILTPCQLLAYVRPVRIRFAFVRTMFRSFDRPEDRPHTLAWLWTQYVAVYAVYLLIYPLLISREVVAWMTIPIIVNALGDGLAEPVGVAFGRHSYRCKALFSRRRYRRTWEGSACVFLSALVGVLVCRHTFNDPQFVLAMVFLPLSSAVAEAMSPHTWDAPFLFLVVGGELAALSAVA